tara:strand:+ start:498 stop:746 length:249 start_codon:yes stop_codon:yes gene_type:complete
MKRRSPVAVFLAASTVLASATTFVENNIAKAGEKNDLGGLKEWTTDQPIEAESNLDEAAKKAAKKAKDDNLCIPIGEGENCW